MNKLLDIIRLIMALVTIVLIVIVVLVTTKVIDPTIEKIILKLGKETTSG